MQSINSTKFRFQDFTFDHYRTLIRETKKKFNFLNYSDLPSDSHFALWRHDVDFSVENALKMAQIEKEEGVKATYFILLHSEFYSFLDKAKVEQVKSIIGQGHDIGLHFDCQFYDATSVDTVVNWLEFEKTLLEKVLCCEIKSFSFHNPSVNQIQMKDWTYAGMVNASATYFYEDVGFVTDSNGFCKEGAILDTIHENHRPMQVLTHPVWWSEQIASPKERMDLFFRERAQVARTTYQNIISAGGRDTHDW